MLAKCEHIKDAAVKVVSAASVWISVISLVLLSVHGQEGHGCGHTVLGTESGTVASRNYPGTYPAGTLCEWTIRVSRGRTLRLLFGDLDIESSPGCSNGSLVVTASNGAPGLGPLCGKLDASERNVTVNSSEATVVFQSGPHRSGRGFLLSYTTDQNPDLISCLQRGSHFVSQSFNAYCPAGCRDVTGDIWGHSEQGYRDTSVLCKSAVHAGVASDSLGGRITVSRGRSLTLYESTFANGILSKMGSLSEKKLLFDRECSTELAVSGLNASSFWEKMDSRGRRIYWSPGNMDPGGQFLPWAADDNDQTPWLELELVERSNITGVITKGSADFYIETYILIYSKDRRNWKVYKDALSRETQVFQAHAEGHVKVLNSLFPSVVARFVRLQAQSWRGRASTQVQILGCSARSAPRPNPRSRPEGDSPSFKVNVGTTAPSPPPTEGPIIVKDTNLSSSQPVVVAVGVVLVLCISCLLAGVWWKRRKKAAQVKKYSLAKIGCQSFQGKSLPCHQSEIISYPLERSVHDALPNPPLNDYADPNVAAGGVGQKVGSTFRPPLDEGYTTPFALSHYDTPGSLPEYAEPLPPEPEYATPFGDQCPDPNLPHGTRGSSGVHAAAAAPPGGTRASSSSRAQYDCPSHRALPNGYCTPSVHVNGPRRPVSIIYAEPQSSDSLLEHTYEEPV